MDSMIEVKDLVKRFGAFTAVDRVAFSVAPGRIFGFLKETLVAPVPRLQIVLGRTLAGVTIALIQGAIVFFSFSRGRSSRWATCPGPFRY